MWLTVAPTKMIVTNAKIERTKDVLEWFECELAKLEKMAVNTQSMGKRQPMPSTTV